MTERRNTLKRLRNLFRDRNGSAAIEFAVLTPVLMTILTGIIDGGYALFVQHSMDRASREAARAYAISKTADLRSVAKATLPTNIAFTVTPSTANGMVTVTVSAPAGAAALIGFIPIFDSLQLSAATSMIPEWPIQPI